MTVVGFQSALGKPWDKDAARVMPPPSHAAPGPTANKHQGEGLGAGGAMHFLTWGQYSAHTGTAG